MNKRHSGTNGPQVMRRPARLGRILETDRLRPWGMSSNRLTKSLHADTSHLQQVVRGQWHIAPRLALLSGRYCGTSPRIWLDRKAEDALRIAARPPEVTKQVARVEPLVIRVSASATHEV